MATDAKGLYVHIPFCVRKCNYCDFCSLPNGGAQVPEAYVDRIIDEILSYSGRVSTPVDTVYFGGELKPKAVKGIEKIFVSAMRKEITQHDFEDGLYKGVLPEILPENIKNFAVKVTEALYN